MLFKFNENLVHEVLIPSFAVIEAWNVKNTDLPDSVIPFMLQVLDLSCARLHTCTSFKKLCCRCPDEMIAASTLPGPSFAKEYNDWNILDFAVLRFEATFKLVSFCC
jgi:hypothetical protein